MGALAAAIPAVLGSIGSGLAAVGGGSALVGAATVGSLALGVKQLVQGAPKSPTITAPAPPPQIQAPTAAAAASPTAPTLTNTNKSLASLAPGLALAGTGGLASSAKNFGSKTLLGQ